MFRQIKDIHQRNKQRKLIEGLPTQDKLDRLAAMAAKPAIEAVTFDESLAYVADNYSPVGPREGKRYILTTTHRGPGKVPLFTDQGTPHAKSFVFSDGPTTRLYRHEVREVAGRSVLGVSEYDITERAGEKPSVTQEFHTTRDARLMAITLQEGQFVKELQEDAGPLGPRQLEEVAWLEQQSGLLTQEQRDEMAVVGFALNAVGPHSGSHITPLIPSQPR